MRLDIYGPNLDRGATPNGETFAVHAVGCQHGVRGPLRHATVRRNVSYEHLVDLCDDYYPPDEFYCQSGEYAGDFYVAPCAQRLPSDETDY